MEAGLKITPEILRLIAEIDEFKGRWEALGRLAPQRLDSLRKVATIASVGSSTRIEGSRLSDTEVERLLSGLGKKSFRNRDEQEVAGYAQVLELITESWQDIPLDENYIRQLHWVLLRHAAKDERHRGAYKTLPNDVQAFDAQGKNLGVVFKTASPFETPRKMKELVDWTAEELKAGRPWHPLLVIAVFVLRFLAIHPFQDGNGRLSRLLTTFLLLKQGYGYAPFSSLEHIVEAHKKDYYLSLRRSQGTLETQKANLDAWVVFFLRSLVAQKNHLASRISEERKLEILPALSEQILKLVRSHGKVSIGQLSKLTNANRNTLKVHLRMLAEKGALIRHGKGRGTDYTSV